MQPWSVCAAPCRRSQDMTAWCGFGSRVQGLGSKFRVQALGFKVLGLGFRVNTGFRVVLWLACWGLGDGKELGVALRLRRALCGRRFKPHLRMAMWATA